MSSSSNGNERPRNQAQGPSGTEALRVGQAKKVAGGLPAVAVATQHGLREMGALRTMRTLLKVNQHDGFDCPGCAWPDPEERSPFEFCENGAKAVAEEATRKRVDPTFFERHSVSELSGWSDHQLGKAGRLTHPMFLAEGANHYRPITWHDAFAHIGQALNNLISPNEAIFYTSGRTSNEAAFLYQLFVRLYGTNNLPDCSNMCHESSGQGLTPVIGIGKGTVHLHDFEEAEAIFVIGQNPGTNHPRMLSALQKAKRSGATIVSINPLREAGTERFKHPQAPLDVLGRGTPLCDLHLPVKINGDVAVLKGIMKALLEMDAQREQPLLDHQFIQKRTLGFAALSDDLKQTSWDDIESQSGIARAEIEKAANIYGESKASIVCWAMGLTQHENGVANIQSVVNLLLLKGNFGRPGAGACPVRGHSNVQGDRTMGIWEAPPESFLAQLENTFKTPMPRQHGLAVVPAIHAMAKRKASVFIALGGNFLSATPDTEYTADALRQCTLTVQISTKLNRSHLITGQEAIILPCLGRTEEDEQESGPQFVSVENSMGIVHRSEGVLNPASSELRSEPAIVSGIAAATLSDSPVDWDTLCGNYDLIRDLIAEVVPGHECYNERVREDGGFSLPNGPREGHFTTPSGKAHFTTHPIPVHSLRNDEYLMMTIRSHDQYNTTIYGLNDRYRGIAQGRRVVFMNRDDMQARGWSERMPVDLKSHFRGEVRKAEYFVLVGYDIPRGCIATYFPEANVLVPIDHTARKSLTPASKSIVITIEPHSTSEESA